MNPKRHPFSIVFSLATSGCLLAGVLCEQNAYGASEWDCYLASGTSSQNAELIQNLSVSAIGRHALTVLREANTRICSGPASLFDSTFSPFSTAIHDSSQNTLFFRDNDTDYPNIVHETIHVMAANATNRMPAQLLAERKYTAYIQSKLANEAGALAIEEATAFQEMHAGRQSIYDLFGKDSLQAPHGVMHKIMSTLLLENPTFINVLANQQFSPPEFVVDAAASRFLLYPAYKRILAHYTKECWRDYRDSLSQETALIDLQPMAFSKNLSCLLTVGKLYGAKGELPETSLALGTLGGRLEPYMQRVLSMAKNEMEIDKMALRFMTELDQSSIRSPTRRPSQSGIAPPTL